jgi:hypothetical protein
MIRLNTLPLPVCAAVVSQLQGRKRQLGPQNSKLRKQYDDLVFSPLDKNTGAVFICCPYCTFHDRLKNTFIENASYKAYRTEAARSIPDNNISSFLTTEHQVAHQFHHFTEKKLEHLGTPTSYVLAKNKNIIKDRPVVSYTRLAPEDL